MLINVCLDVLHDQGQMLEQHGGYDDRAAHDIWRAQIEGLLNKGLLIAITSVKLLQLPKDQPVWLYFSKQSVAWHIAK